MKLISKPIQQNESRKISAIGIIVPFPVKILRYNILVKFSILRWTCNLDASLDASPGGGGAVYLKTRYTL